MSDKLDKNFALIALLKTLHEKGNDSWSAFAYLAMSVIDNGQTQKALSAKFYSTYRVELPAEVVYTIVARLKREEKIEYDNRDGPYSLTTSGKSKSQEARKSAATFRKDFDLLIEDFEKHLASKSIKLENPEKEIVDFVDTNLSFTSKVLTENNSRKDSDAEIANYILQLEQKNVSLFQILQNIFFGRLYLQTFKLQAPIEKDAKFNKLSVYIDTNIIFNLLGIDGPELKQTASRLVKTIQNIQGVDVRALDITLEETNRTLLNATDISNTLSEYKVDSLGWRLKQLGYDSTTIISLVENLQDTLEEMGITQELITVTPSEDDISHVRGLSEQFHQNKNPNAIEHDASVVVFLRELRQGIHTSLLEKSKAVFVSVDNALIYDSRKLSEDSKVFPTIISPVELACLIWLKNIGNEEIMQASLRQALMVYAREKMHESGVWDEFVKRLQEEKKTGTIGDSEIALIITSQNTRSLLYEKGQDAVSEILDTANIDKLKRKHREIAQDRLKRQKESRRIDNKRQRLAKRAATIIVNTLALIIAAVIMLVYLFIIYSIGLDVVADAIEVFVPLILIVLVLFGIQLNTGEFTNKRHKLIESSEKRVDMLLKRHLY